MNKSWDGFYTPSRPRTVDGGIKARSTRGAIGTRWWSRRFIEVLEGFGVGSRLKRGKNYARRGQVMELAILPGMVSAKVQGSRSRPYRVRIGVQAFGKAEWTRIEETLAADAWYLAQLLSGEIPDDIEQVFTKAGLPLFPAEARDLSMDCSCPDWEVPCKHLAAVCYLLAERFDEDPFAILAWRGRERDELLENLAALRKSGIGPAGASEGQGKPLSECLDSYFALQGELPQLVARQSSMAALLDEAPPMDLSVRHRSVTELLRPAYLAFAAVDQRA